MRYYYYILTMIFILRQSQISLQRSPVQQVKSKRFFQKTYSQHFLQPRSYRHHDILHSNFFIKFLYHAQGKRLTSCRDGQIRLPLPGMLFLPAVFRSPVSNFSIRMRLQILIIGVVLSCIPTFTKDLLSDKIMLASSAIFFTI